MILPSPLPHLFTPGFAPTPPSLSRPPLPLPHWSAFPLFPFPPPLPLLLAARVDARARLGVSVGMGS